MTVYVSQMCPCVTNRKWRWREHAYLVANTEEELLDFATKLGLSHSWLHRSSTLTHFDLTESKRHQAIRMGAKPANIYDLVQSVREGELVLARPAREKKKEQ